MHWINERTIAMRMKRANRLPILGIIAVLQLGAFGFAQNTRTVGNENITAMLTNLRDPSWEKRAHAFYQLVGSSDGRSNLIPSRLAIFFHTNPDREDELKLALIQLLNTENSMVESQNEEFYKTGKTVAESYTNYYGDVIAAVSGLNDPRAVNALVGAMATGGMATRGLARLGPDAIDLLILKFQSRDVITRAAAVRALTTMYQPENREKLNDDVSRRKIKDAFMKAARDEDGGVRLAAVYGLALIPDDDTVLLLRRLAASDPSRLPGQADEGGPFFPVRQAARRVLDQIARSGVPPTNNK
jgi:HEAT repeat protein